MKKALLIAGVLVATTATSCKKNYTCDCDITIDVPVLGNVTSFTSETIRAKKKDAEQQCKNTENNTRANLTATGGTGTVKCTLRSS